LKVSADIQNKGILIPTLGRVENVLRGLEPLQVDEKKSKPTQVTPQKHSIAQAIIRLFVAVAKVCLNITWLNCKGIWGLFRTIVHGLFTLTSGLLLVKKRFVDPNKHYAPFRKRHDQLQEAYFTMVSAYYYHQSTHKKSLSSLIWARLLILPYMDFYLLIGILYVQVKLSKARLSQLDKGKIDGKNYHFVTEEEHWSSHNPNYDFIL